MARGPHNAERQALIEGDQKLTVSEGRVLGLYDLAADPARKTDLSASVTKAAALLRARRSGLGFRKSRSSVPVPLRQR